MSRKRKSYRPIRKNSELVFRALFNYWSVKLTDKTYLIVKDNRFSGTMLVDYDPECKTHKKVIVRFNARRLAKWPYAMIINGVFHEIKHILQGDMPYETDEEQIECEYDAEKYAVHMMKIHYPKDLPVCIKHVKHKLSLARWRKVSPIHAVAYEKIKEYQ